MKRPLTLWILFFFLVQIAAPTWAFAQSGGRFEVTINARSLNVRSGPGTDFDILASVSEGDRVVGLREDSGWVQIELPTGAIGWVSQKYVIRGPAITETPAEPQRERATPPPPKRTTPPPATRSGGSGGGIGMGGVLKWTTLIGAVALGGLAFNEMTQGNDAYDEYEELALAGDAEAAEIKWDETADHDDKALLYGGVAGGLFGLFLLQQFVFGGGNDSADLDQRNELPAGLAFNPRTGELRANLLQVRF